MQQPICSAHTRRAFARVADYCFILYASTALFDQTSYMFSTVLCRAFQRDGSGGLGPTITALMWLYTTYFHSVLC